MTKAPPLPRLLFIDDDPGVLSTLSMVFQRDYETMEARNVDDALSLFQMKRPQAVTLDLCMPHIDGLEGLRHLRRLDAKVPIIVLTGNSTHESAKEALRLGATDYLEKPFDATEVRESVQRHLSGLSGPARPLTARPASATAPELLECLHDLSNPMTIISMQCEVMDMLLQQHELEGKKLEAAKLRIAMDTVLRQTRHCRELLKQWKEVGRITHARPDPVDICELLSNLAEDLLPSTTEHTVRIDWRKPASPVFVLGHLRELTRMFSNLVLNAVQACPPKGGSVVIACQSAPGCVRVDITDNGPGISPAHFPHIFRPFFTTKGPAGNGLGLHIARRIALAHQGRIEVSSQAGKGCRFSVFLPLPAAGAAS